ncbi:MAG: hypothetical protein AB7S50_02610 [Bacteroidales bacterium]
MKKTIYLLLFAFIATTTFVSCEDEEETKSPFITVKMGAQSNTTIGAFYSIEMNSVYNQAVAFTKQDTIDFLCFYEHDEINDRINDMTLASPGANITDIFVDDITTSPDVWTTKNLTKFQEPNPAMTVAQFDLLKETDAIIETSFDNTVLSGNKKAKLLAVNDIYAFKTHNNQYGLLKVTEVLEGNDGYIKFVYIIKK